MGDKLNLGYDVHEALYLDYEIFDPMDKGSGHGEGSNMAT